MVEAGIADAEKMVPLIFIAMIIAVILQNLQPPLAKLLKVRQPAPNTILIIGANHVARAIARGLKIKTFRCTCLILHGRTAKWHAWMAYLVTGNPQSEHAERYLPLTTIRSVLALSPNRHHNALGVQYFSHL